MTKDETLEAIIAGAKANGSWDKKYPDDDKKAQPAQEPPSEWAGIKAILDEYGLQAIDFVADWKAAQPAQDAYTEGYRAGFDNGHALGFTEGSDMTLTQPAQEPVGNEFFEAFAAKQPKQDQRPWVGLTDDQFLEAARLAEDGNYLVAFQRIQQWLKEGNT